jgi:phosphoglycerate dehydrogenase-like enzyme
MESAYISGRFFRRSAMSKPPLLFYYGDRLISNWTQPIVDYLRTSLERFSTPALVHVPFESKSYRDDRWESYEAVGFAGVSNEDEIEPPPNTKIIGFTFSGVPDSLKDSLDSLKVFRGDAGWSRSVAECGINLALNCLRQSAFHHTHLATGGAHGWRFYGGQLSDRIDVVSGELAGKQVGILGVGKIGGHAGILAKAFGAEVRGFDPYKDDAYFEQLGIQRITLEDMAKWSQIIIVCAAPTESAVKILSAELVQTMAKGSIIVIVSRARVTDFAEIRKRVLADELVLGVDVYDVEPLPVDDPLRNRWNVVHFPHIAGRTFDSGKRFVDLCAEGFRRYFAGEDVPQVIRPGDLPHEPLGWLCE